MSTPVINAIDNVNQTSLNTVFAAVAADPTARDNLSQSDRNIDAVSTNVGVIEELNVSEEVIRKMLCRREGRDPANFADLDAVAADQGLMQAIAARQESSKILARSQKASAAAIASQTARDEMFVSQTAMQEIAASQTAMQEATSSQTAMQEIAASQTAMTEVGASQTAMQEVAASQTAMTEIDQVDFAVRAIMCGTTSQDPTSFADADAISQDTAAMSEIAGNATTMNTIAASQTAMQEVGASQTAMEEMASSSTAMTEIDQVGFAVRAIMCGTTSQDPTSFADADAISQDAAAMSEIAGNATTMNTIAASQTAMDALADSQTALDEIGNNAIVQNTVYNNGTAISALNSSSLIENIGGNVQKGAYQTFKNDRVILLSQNPGAFGNRENQAQFGGNDNSFPHTADRIRRESNDFFSRNTRHNASYIDISNS